ncbi:MAG: LytTR family transcriptional regulator [Prevotellaceae bacterium]|jgi:DNA-binding LytR/AlgR family response regulator|nr:LytTR family transcriptional regulator [Prevotellaceae bacterium]
MNYDMQNTKSLMITSRNITKQIIVSYISHIVCDAYICDIFTQSEKITCSKLLKDFEAELAEYGFIRINHNILVNARYIKFINNKKRVITLKNSIELQISVRRWKFFKAIIVNL